MHGSGSQCWSGRLPSCGQWPARLKRGDAALWCEIAGWLQRLAFDLRRHRGRAGQRHAGKLGNDVAIKAFRAGTVPFPDGTIIARLAWKQTTSEENSRALGPVAEKQLGPEGAQKLLSQSFVAGPALNVQFMVKDSKKYASTGGWGLPSSTTASRLMRRCTRRASDVTRLRKIETSSSPVTRVDQS